VLRLNHGFCCISTSSKGLPRIVFENKHAVVIDKPTGIAHHSSDDEEGIMKVVRKMQQADAKMYDGELFSVHRLDRETSGILLFAKTKTAAAHFSKQFADRTVVKYCKLCGHS
jgi:23S rRNA-/tRNA-specific pseudouridylate synthase